MQTGLKRYNVVIRGRVRDIGFRDLIAQMASFFGFRGYIFNDVDGSVRVVLEGTKSSVDSFLEDIKIKTKSIGAEIEALDKREVARDIDLPPKFVKIPTTELEEIGRKLDVGIDHLQGLKEGQETLIKGQEILINGQNTLIKGQEGLLKGQEGVKSILTDVKNVLEKIAEK